MTMQLWTVFRQMCGLPGKTPVREIPSHQLALFFSRQREQIITETERAEFGFPTRRRNYNGEL